MPVTLRIAVAGVFLFTNCTHGISQYLQIFVTNVYLQQIYENKLTPFIVTFIFYFVKTAFGCHTVLNLDYISNCICVNAPVVFIRTQDTEKKTITSSMKTGFRFARFIWIKKVVLKMLRLFVNINRIIQWILCLAI